MTEEKTVKRGPGRPKKVDAAKVAEPEIAKAKTAAEEIAELATSEDIPCRGTKYYRGDGRQKVKIIIGIGESGEDAPVEIPDPFKTGEWIVIQRNKAVEVSERVLGILAGMYVTRRDSDGVERYYRRAPWYRQI